ncbi:MAG: SRPBCC domain-containing protein [Imperialibacter sp.]|uniref:SRPBCC domain-containing protein n=1 Tax=Imperialibacter sp. TaxID=2038411 RepID=UPI0032EAC8DB
MGAVTKIYLIKAPLQKVYNALTIKALIERWSGAEATMDTNVGGEFALWGGSIHGINRQISNKLIVQDWKEKNWSAFSKCTFNLSESGGTTTLELLHDNIPSGSVKSIDNGWDEYYLTPLKELVESSL